MMTLEELVELVQHQQEQIADLERRLGAVDSREEHGFEGLDVRCDSLSAQVHRVESSIYDVKEDSSRTNYTVDTIERMVDRLEGRVSGVERSNW